MPDPLNTWREKLAYLQEQEAICSDAAQKFALKKQIEEAEQKISELEERKQPSAPAEKPPNGKPVDHEPKYGLWLIGIVVGAMTLFATVNGFWHEWWMKFLFVPLGLLAVSFWIGELSSFRYGLGALVLSSCCVVLLYRLLSPTPNRALPSLTANIVIDSWDGTNFSYHYEAENVGHTTAYNIRHGAYGCGVSDTEFPMSSNLRMRTELGPGQRMKITPPVVVASLESCCMSTVLRLSYSRDPSEENKLGKEFSFLMMKDSMRVGQFPFDACRDYQSPLEKEFGDLGKHFNADRLAIGVVVPQTNHLGNPNSCVVTTTNRFLVVNAEKGIVSFASRDASGEWINLVGNWSNGSYHVLFFGWNPHGALLGIDGRELMYPTNFYDLDQK